MNNSIPVFLICLVLCSFGSYQVTGQSKPTSITPQALADSLANTNTVIVDVRTEQETEKGYIDGAMFINFYETDFVEKLRKLDKNKTIFLYCQASGRSKKAAEILAGEGYPKVYYLAGGIMDWQKASLPLKKK
jgi:rhodanese-related sulfurtransferase